MGHGWESRRRQWLIFVGITIMLLGLAVLLLGARGAADSITSYETCREAGYPITDSNPPLCRTASRSFLGPDQPESTPAAPRTAADFDILVDGDTHSRLPEHGQTLISSQAQWLAYWRTAHAGLPTLPPLIPVDFSTSSVVGVSLGAQPTTGYGLKIATITTGPAGTTVDLTESSPTTTCTVLSSLTNRYLIVRTAKLTEPVSFRITQTRHHCP